MVGKKRGGFRRRKRQIRVNIWLDQRMCCHYCKKKIYLEDATIDHIKPLSKGGSNRRTNLVVACSPCNSNKGDSWDSNQESN